jgi:hypothetical protein
MAVVFLGGPLDGLERVFPDDPVELRFAQLREMPWLGRDGLSPEELQQPLPINYVAYRQTHRTVRGRRVYSLVTRP